MKERKKERKKENEREITNKKYQLKVKKDTCPMTKVLSIM